MRRIRFGWLLALSLLAACDWVTDVGTEGAPRGATEPGMTAEGAAPTPAPGAPSLEPGASDVTRPRPSDYQPPTDGEEAAPAAAAEESPEQDEPERDLSAELRNLVGDPSSCLTGLAPSVTDVTVRVSASTSVTGIVTRSSVSGSGLDDQARECVRQRLDRARFRSPVPGAPREVTAELTLHRDPPPEPSGDQAGEDETRGTWRHGIFYPGGVPDEDSEE